MRLDVLTIFPGWFDGPLTTSLLGRAAEQGLVDLRVHDLRDATSDRHRTVDDAPYGGGAGMVMRADVWIDAAEAVWNDRPLSAPTGGGEVGDGEPGDGATRDGGAGGDGAGDGGAGDAPRFRAGGDRPRTILLTPRGRPLTQELARELAEEPRLVLCCGRYEGIDERVHELVATDEVSIGDYVLFGGEVAAAVVIEAVTRHVPGVVGNAASPVDESFSTRPDTGERLLEHPQYTRPAEVRGHGVPPVLTSGDHGAVEAWRLDRARELTRRRRPDLLAPDVDATDG